MKNLILVLALIGISINTSLSQKDNENLISSIESKAKELILTDFPNAENTGKFNSVTDVYLKAKGHPTISQFSGVGEFPTEITSIVFPKDYFSDSQIARESVIILEDLLREHGYKLNNNQYKEYSVQAKNEGDNIKIVIFVSE
jgi:hypothetical protein